MHTPVFEVSRKLPEFGLRKLRLGLFGTLLVWLFCGCSLLHKSSREDAPSPPSPAMSSANHHGYALLFDLVGDEKDISKLHFIKHERPELKNLLQEIARASGAAYTKLEKIGKAAPGINLKDPGLPAAEIQTRKDISKFKEKAILSQSDKELEIQLLLSQNEALTYGAHLAGAVARSETDPRRQQTLQQISATLLALQKKVFEMFTKNYSWSEAK